MYFESWIAVMLTVFNELYFHFRLQMLKERKLPTVVVSKLMKGLKCVQFLIWTNRLTDQLDLGIVMNMQCLYKGQPAQEVCHCFPWELADSTRKAEVKWVIVPGCSECFQFPSVLRHGCRLDDSKDIWSAICKYSSYPQRVCLLRPCPKPQ